MDGIEEAISLLESLEYRLVGGIISMIIGMIIAIKPILAVFTHHKLKTWPTILGKVIKSEVSFETDNEGDEMYFLDLQYVYHISGKEYTSHGRYIEAEIKQSWRGNLKTLAESYSLGDEITIYVNPENEAQSVVDLTFPNGYKFQLWVAGLLILTGILPIIVGLFDR